MAALPALALVATAVAAPLPAQNRRPYPAAKVGGNYLHSYLLPPVGNSTPWAPAWSPDGRWIAVSLAGSIWRIDPANGRAEELVAGPKYYSTPAWSPDGRWIVYTADDGGKTLGLEILDVATGQTHPLTDDAQLYVDPRWSPDGARLAYATTRPNGYFNVVVRPIRDGAWTGGEVPVTDDSNSGRDRPYFTAQDLHITPAWLRDGRELLLVSNRGVAAGSGNVVRVRADSGAFGASRPAPRAVLREQTLYQTRPDVSPDGTTFVYASARGGTQPYNDLFVARVDGTGAPRRLTRFAFDAFAPRWSPDGRRIAFVSNERGLPELALLDVATGTHRLVPVGPRTWKRPAGTLRMRIADGAGAAPTAARVHLTAADGKFYAPSNAYARWSWATDRVFHTAGTFDVELPAGPVTVDVVKGFEYAPRHLTAVIAPGQVTELTVPLERVADMAARGWCSGSSGAHIHGGGYLKYDPGALLDAAASEDVAVVSVPFAHVESRVPTAEIAGGRIVASAASRGGRLLIAGQEHRPPF